MFTNWSILMSSVFLIDVLYCVLVSVSHLTPSHLFRSILCSYAKASMQIEGNNKLISMDVRLM